MQCGHVDGLRKSPAALLLLSCCLGDNNGLQFHLLGHPGQAALRGDVDASVVARPRCDAGRPRAAAHHCTPGSVAAAGEEGEVRRTGGAWSDTNPHEKLAAGPASRLRRVLTGDAVPHGHGVLSTAGLMALG